MLLHAATSIGLFLVLREMTGELWPSAFASAVFAVHPQRVESVAWIAERRDVLSGFLFVLTLAAYLAYVRHGRAGGNVRRGASLGRYLLVALTLALGLMAKSMLVTVPPLLLLLDYWPLARFGQAADVPQAAPALPRPRFGWLVVEKLPLLGLALADGAITLHTHAVDVDAMTLSWTTRLANCPVALITYLFQFFCPINLAAFYPFPADGYPAWKVVGAGLLAAAITISAIVFRRRAPYLLVGWLWFVGMLTPVLGAVKVAARSDGRSLHVFAGSRPRDCRGVGRLATGGPWGPGPSSARRLRRRW